MGRSEIYGLEGSGEGRQMEPFSHLSGAVNTHKPAKQHQVPVLTPQKWKEREMERDRKSVV